MLDAAERTAALVYYAKHGAALFPIPAGQKAPTGLVASFKHDFSRDPSQWEAWERSYPGCNFGVVAFASNWIIADIDTTTSGREVAWSAWCELCAEWEVAPVAPVVQSARGGWHAYFSLPEDIDASALRQPDAIKGLINLRCVGFTVAAGSYYDGTAKNEASGPYLLLSQEAPTPAPAALIQHCTRANRTALRVSKPGERDRGDVAALVAWLTERGAFADYESWVSIGMSLRLEFDSDGLDIWRLTHDGTVTGDVEDTKWNSFAADPTAQTVTLASWLQRAHALGWRGTVRKSAAALFGVDAVASIAASAGATLSSAPVALADTQKTVAALGQPILDQFFAGTNDAPTRPGVSDYPTVPVETMAQHPLYEMLRAAIDRIVAMAESGSFRQDRVLKALAVLHAAHFPTCEALCQRLAAMGAVISPGKLDSAIKNFEWKVRTEQNTAAGFITDAKGNPVPENSDNVHAFVRQRAVKLRFNIWKDHVEVADADKDSFIQLSDHVFGELLMDAKNSHFKYHPAETLFRRGLVSNARKTMYDPIVDRLDALAAAWDGMPRLLTWLSHTCGVPCDTYHQAVGRNLIGGMVRRARKPGCEQSETVLFISATQGTGKSTMCKILALDSAWHTDSFKFEGTPQNVIPQLAGKWVIELSELAGMAHKDMEHVKSFLSATTDNYTKKYEAFATDHPRRCVFIGTSNDRRPLVDVTGNRRFLPVHVVGEVDTDWLRANVEQLMGEAAARDDAGETFAIPRGLWATASTHQEASRAMTPVEEMTFKWFDRPEGEGGLFVTCEDISRALKMAGLNSHARYSSFLDKLGWRNENLVLPENGRRCRVWVRHTSNSLCECTRLEPLQVGINAPVDMRMVSRVPVTGGPTLPSTH